MPWTQGCQEALFTVGPWGSGRPLGWQSHPALGLCPARPGWAWRGGSWRAGEGLCGGRAGRGISCLPLTGADIWLLVLADWGGLPLSTLTCDCSYVRPAGTKRTGRGPEICPADVCVCAMLTWGCPRPWGAMWGRVCAPVVVGGAWWGDRRHWTLLFLDTGSAWHCPLRSVLGVPLLPRLQVRLSCEAPPWPAVPGPHASSRGGPAPDSGSFQGRRRNLSWLLASLAQEFNVSSSRRAAPVCCRLVALVFITNLPGLAEPG